MAQDSLLRLPNGTLVYREGCLAFCGYLDDIEENKPKFDEDVLTQISSHLCIRKICPVDMGTEIRWRVALHVDLSTAEHFRMVFIGRTEDLTQEDADREPYLIDFIRRAGLPLDLDPNIHPQVTPLALAWVPERPEMWVAR